MTFVPRESETALLTVLRCGMAVQRLSDINPLPISLCELMGIMQLAREHTVQALVANAAIGGKLKIADGSLTDRQRVVMALMQTNMQHQRSYFLFEKTLADFAKVMDGHKIRYVVFKGVAVARHYPVPYARTMGDVDFYVVPEEFDRAVAVIERGLHVEIEKEDIDKHFSFDYQGIRFEMHYQIETFGSGRHQRYFNRMIDECIAQGVDSFSVTDSEFDDDKTKVSVLPPTEDLIVVFKHWFNHLLVEGVGLRQTVDLAVLLNVYKEKIDVARLVIALEKIGYIRAFRAMLAMVRKYFGLQWVDSLCALDARDERFADKLMATVMESGNFGRKAYRNHAAGKRKSLETATRALRHCAKFFRLAPWDICCLVPRRIGITLKPLFRAACGCFCLQKRRGERMS